MEGKKRRSKGGLIVFKPPILLYRGKQGKTLNELCEERDIERHTLGKGLMGIAVSPVKAVEILEALKVPEDKWDDIFVRGNNHQNVIGAGNGESNTPEDF